MSSFKAYCLSVSGRWGIPIKPRKWRILWWRNHSFKDASDALHAHWSECHRRHLGTSTFRLWRMLQNRYALRTFSNLFHMNFIFTYRTACLLSLFTSVIYFAATNGIFNRCSFLLITAVNYIVNSSFCYRTKHLISVCHCICNFMCHMVYCHATADMGQ